MLVDGISLSQNGEIVNAHVESGLTLPVTSLTQGRLFYLTATDGSNAPGLYIYDTTAVQWVTGDVTSITAGSGLSGGGVRGDITLSADMTVLASKSTVDTHIADQTVHLTSAQNTLVDGITVASSDINQLSGISGNVQTQLGEKVAKAGDTMTGNLIMSAGSHVTINDTPVNGTDATNKAYVDSLSSGLVWLDSVCLINMISMDETNPTNITTKNKGDAYVVPPTAGAAWSSKPGHIMIWDGAVFLDKGSMSTFNLTGRFVISGYSDTVASGATLTGQDNKIANVTFAFEYPIIAVDTGLKQFSVSGDHTTDFAASSHFYVGGSTGNDEYYTVVSSTYTGGNTVITVSETVPNATVNGEIFNIGTITYDTPANKNAIYVCNSISQYAYSQFVYDSTGSTWTLFGGNSAAVPGVGLTTAGNIWNINLGAGISQLPTDEVGVDVYSAGGLMTTVDGSTSNAGTTAQLSVKLDGTTLSKSANGLKVSDVGHNEFTATAGQTVFTFSGFTNVVGSHRLMVFIGGVKQLESSYTETTTDITLSSGLSAGTSVEIYFN